MNINIWDKKLERWISIRGVEYIVMLDNDLFKIDGVEYHTDEYELNFIHKEV